MHMRTAWRMGVACIAAVVCTSCSTKPESRPGQIQPLTSPNGQFVLTVPIERNPSYNNVGVWVVTISTVGGECLYEDDDSRCAARFNSYWTWDDENRVWLTNSDNGCVYFWEIEDTVSEGEHAGRAVWRKTEWQRGMKTEDGRAITPPKSLRGWG